MQTITTEVYQYDELDDSAKKRARDWWRGVSAGDNFFAELVIEDAADIADLMGIDLRQTRKTRADGSCYYAPSVYWSGFCSQGDGASFECSYRYKKGAVKAVEEQTGGDSRLVGIAKALHDAQRKHFYRLAASSTVRGHYVHSGSMDISVEHLDDAYRDIGESEENIRDALRGFADWVYQQLKAAYDNENSDESVADCIRANEYTFTANGHRFG